MEKSSEQKFNEVIGPIINDFNRLSQTNPLYAEAIRRIKQQRGVEDAHEPESALTNDKLPSLHDFGPDKIEFVGLEKNFRACLDTLSNSSSDDTLQVWNRWIRSTHEGIENLMLTKAISARP